MPLDLVLAGPLQDRPAGELGTVITDDGGRLARRFPAQTFSPLRATGYGEGWRGSGLGLLMVRAIALEHGGTGSFQRWLGLSIFILELPRWRALLDPEPNPSALSDG